MIPDQNMLSMTYFLSWLGLYGYQVRPPQSPQHCPSMRWPDDAWRQQHWYHQLCVSHHPAEAGHWGRPVPPGQLCQWRPAWTNNINNNELHVFMSSQRLLKGSCSRHLRQCWPLHWSEAISDLPLTLKNWDVGEVSSVVLQILWLYITAKVNAYFFSGMLLSTVLCIKKILFKKACIFLI